MGSIRRAAKLVDSSGCHTFGLAPDGSFLFGMHAQRCRYDLRAGAYRDVPWKSVDIVDIQAQRLLSDNCASSLGIEAYVSVVSSIAAFARERNASISVVSQVSFRYTPPLRMKAAMARVAGVVDGVYFSYPSNNPNAECRYCSPRNLESFLEFLRGPARD